MDAPQFNLYADLSGIRMGVGHSIISRNSILAVWVAFRIIVAHWCKNLENYAVSASKQLFISTIKFRYQHTKARMSFFDAVGYVYATTHRMKCVTGNKAFEHFDGVEFQKK